MTNTWHEDQYLLWERDGAWYYTDATDADAPRDARIGVWIEGEAFALGPRGTGETINHATYRPQSSE